MNERRIPVVSLVAIVLLTFAVLFGLERLLAWEERAMQKR